MAEVARFERAWLSSGDVPDELRSLLAGAGIEVLQLPRDRPREAPADGELVVLVPGGGTTDAFVLCSQLKAPPRRVTVFFVVPAALRATVEPIARFCMADAVLDSEDLATGASDAREELAGLLFQRPQRESVDVLLARLEGRLGSDAVSLADRVLSGLSGEREQSFVSSVTDADTGLFGGPFMAFKLEEEFKRSWRFRTPLAVLLLDFPRLREVGSECDRILGEIAGVLLNECRDIDILGRYDATSYLLLLPSTGSKGATVLARRVIEQLAATVRSEVPLEPAVAVVAVPRTGIERKDDLLDLARLTLVSAWAEEGLERVRLAE